MLPKKTTTEIFEEGAPSDIAHMLGLLLHHLCGNVNYRDRLGLAFAFLGTDPSVSDVRMILRALSVSELSPLQDALQLLLCVTAVRVRRLMVYSQAIAQDADVDAASCPMVSGKTKVMWTRDVANVETAQQALMKERTFKQRHERQKIPGGIQELHHFSLCEAILTTRTLDLESKQCRQNPSGPGAKLASLEGIYLLGPLCGMWLIVQRVPESTAFSKIAEIAKFEDDSGVWEELRTYGHAWGGAPVYGANLYMSTLDLGTLVQASRIVRRSSNETMFQSLRYQSWVSVIAEAPAADILGAQYSNSCSCWDFQKARNKQSE